MSLHLHTLKPAKGSIKRKKRIGRGLASTGTYSGRGVKGQRSRSGGRNGLQKKGLRPILLNIPKSRGFKSIREKPCIVNIEQLNHLFMDGARITPDILFAKGCISDKAHGVKILGKGTIQKKFLIEHCLISASAKEKIETAGGSVLI
ncbi:50S ribosomal protein L15 [Candidatus Uhrbacteria bacterium CG_4_9_14_3_um_filter_36_7]|uniref:Large ribosomal subunit protein uL15 n=1 Tax=Candidatus Uhrbacteria bacterium CG_4_9_14_3_um_filter_36_7 TaxID=1975033 RepID=A0A2M7XHT2_9BACT|nr:MAG: 50S ribosomal protein L15 [Candidatus Uhrbacteria bacterium CG_4_9_14_3_um_filter_36_7]